MKEIIVDELYAHQRLDVVVSKITGLSRSHIKNLIDGKNITVDGKVQKSGFETKIGKKIEINLIKDVPLDVKAEDIDFKIVYEDEYLVVIDKPQGLVVHPCQTTKSGTLVNGLLAKIKDLSGINGVLRPGIVHRLDKNTSGLMVVAKNDVAHSFLAAQIKNKTCKRKYLALLSGNLKDDEGVIKTYLSRSKIDRKKFAVSGSGKEAISEYKVLKRYRDCCLVEFSLKTGRTHQIRVHAAYLHHPVVGDDVYGKKVNGLNGQLLHSYYLEFVHPKDGKVMKFEITLPDYFAAYIKKQVSLN